MLKKISNSELRGNGNIKVLYPGIAISDRDSGIASIGRIDFATIPGNHIIPMHPHKNDEILSYLRIGECEHKDSEGFVKTINKNRLMLMKAGKLFHHEEKMQYSLVGLQIFIRPGKKDLKPEVVFLDLEEVHSENKWRLIASPSKETTFQFSSQTWIFDAKLSEENKLNLPQLANEGLTCLLYIFNGQAIVNGNIHLKKKDSLVIKGEDITVATSNEAELVLFVTDEQAEVYEEGMYSGNHLNRL